MVGYQKIADNYQHYWMSNCPLLINLRCSILNPTSTQVLPC